MIDCMSETRATRYPCVYWRGDALYYTYRDQHRRKRMVRFGLGDPREANYARLAAQEKADLIRAGRLDLRQANAQDSAARPLDAVVAEYANHLAARGDSPMHVKTTTRFIQRWAASCGVRTILDADAVKMQRWLAESRWAARTRNYARSSVLGLCRWAADYGRAPHNPIPTVLIPKANEDADRRRLSRALTPAEFAAILAVAAPSRRAYYLIAATVGIRWREIARLTWADVDLDRARITVQASQAKTKRRADLPLLPGTIEALQALRDSGEAHAGGRLFACEPRLRTWNRDLERAGIARTDDRGRSADRKCLRMSYCTWLKDAGVDLRDAQRLMRHSSPALTANTYTDPRFVNLATAQGKLATTLLPVNAKQCETKRHNAKRA